ncbi:MAG: DNA adenine methylase [Porphyromonas somerae]|uniref:DNA adenine methylase n=1 Tax=Porphyromonas somerae TaxID=322095 RepID=UPI0026EC9EC5|nr:DNA adenine methylase [Porphyromonas somerae]MDD7558621.1 DNA adenine methylase [Porphyromonas somerae]MDY3884538.1 DNA adenine methylase [Porphyromonas somerae]MDY5816287.1 DNA adenine methylase [Porphyromonas somerae]
MNYIGSKLSLLPFIESVVKEVYKKPLKDAVFCDLFAGTGIVGRHFKPKAKKIIANDLEYYSYVLNRNYIGNHRKLEGSENIFKALTQAPTLENGFIFENYSEGGKANRLYFSSSNGKKIDTIRTLIEEWKRSKIISEDMYYYLLASLLESADKVANTASVYGAYLKRLKKTAENQLLLQPARFHINSTTHDVYQEDANELIKSIKGDILYLDPPYNNRQYGANYHILNTIAIYQPFAPKGKTGLPDYNRSKYCKKDMVRDQLEELLANAAFPYIFLSYNNEGLMSIEEIEEIFNRYGDYKLFQSDYRRFRSDKETRRNHKGSTTTEFIHVLTKR